MPDRTDRTEFCSSDPRCVAAVQKRLARADDPDAWAAAFAAALGEGCGAREAMDVADELCVRPKRRYAKRGTVDRHHRADLRRRIAAAAADTHRDPSEAQREAQNYRKGRVSVHGLPITIETPRGGVRSGKTAGGKAWSVTMAHHYGYIRLTESEADGDHVDCFIGPHPESELVFVVDQLTRGGRFDEPKVMLGFRSLREARKGYLACYSPGWTGLGEITAMTLPAFKRWLQRGDTGRPVARQKFHREGGPVRYAGGGHDVSGQPRGDDGKWVHGAHASSLHGKREALKQAIAAHKEERRAAFGRVKERAERADALAAQHTEAAGVAMNNIAWVGSDDGDDPFTKLETAISEYDDGDYPGDRIERLKEIEAAAKAALEFEQPLQTEPTAEGVAKAQELRAKAKELRAEQKELMARWDQLHRAGDKEAEQRFIEEQQSRLAGRGNLLDQAYKLEDEAGALENPGDGVTAKEREENKPLLREIIAAAKAARQQVRAYVQHRRELRAIRRGESMG